MTDETTFDTDELKDEAKRATERISVAGSDLIKTVQGLLREAAVRRITVQDKNGRTLIEIPLYAGVIGALLIGSWTVLALVAAWFAEVSILIERDVDADGESSAAADALDRAAAGATEAARPSRGSARPSAARPTPRATWPAARPIRWRGAWGKPTTTWLKVRKRPRRSSRLRSRRPTRRPIRDSARPSPRAARAASGRPWPGRLTAARTNLPDGDFQKRDGGA
ncbi:MAG: DUF4342 domain-containing protein [Anaerolineae bacterium]|nr:DUF4342 domain-containing protein [Anaerolineae bacterium]